jgi:hypothetical protein
MTKKMKGRTEATQKTFNSPYLTQNASRINALVVRLAVCGLLPVGLAIWIIRRLHSEAA